VIKQAVILSKHSFYCKELWFIYDDNFDKDTKLTVISRATIGMNFIYKYGLLSDDKGTLLLNDLHRCIGFDALIYDYKKEGRLIKKHIVRDGCNYRYLSETECCINFGRIKICD
jgi:hypothetical protein